jgi:DNA invertase Pin-like site-specific DNA recombinase
MISESKPQAALIYTRVATPKPCLISFGLDDQFRRCRNYAEQVGLEVRATFSDGCRSGMATTWGPGMLSMLQYINDNRSTRFVIIVDSTSRLTRNLDRYFTLKRKLKAVGSEIHTPRYGLDSDPKLIEGLLAALSSKLNT